MELPEDPHRRRKWIAITTATVVMMFSYFAYAAAFAGSEGDPDSFDSVMLGLALLSAPFVFITTAFLSHASNAPMATLKAMALSIPVALTVGLLSPVLGATAAFGFGGALTLRRPASPAFMKWRILAVIFSIVYTLSLLALIPPAGIFTGAIIPLIMLGLADEYALWANQDDEAGS